MLVGTCCMRKIYNGIFIVYWLAMVGTIHEIVCYSTYCDFGAYLRHLG
jgi:hypothetical protein